MPLSRKDAFMLALRNYVGAIIALEKEKEKSNRVSFSDVEGANQRLTKVDVAICAALDALFQDYDERLKKLGV